MKSNPVVSCRPAAKRKKKIPSSLLKKAPLISSIILTFGSPLADAQLLHIGDLPDSEEFFQITEDASYGAIVVGGNGTGTLEIIEGVSVQTSSLALGVGADALGTGIFSGTLSVTTTLQIGLSGTGTMIVEEGGHVFAMLFQVGLYNGSSGTTIVRGELSINGSFINFGESGDSTLIIENGGSVSATPLLAVALGANQGSNATADIQGTFSITGMFLIGRQGTGIVDIGNGGLLSASQVVFGQAFDAGDGALNLNNGGTLETELIFKAGGNHTLNLNGGNPAGYRRFRRFHLRFQCGRGRHRQQWSDFRHQRLQYRRLLSPFRIGRADQVRLRHAHAFRSSHLRRRHGRPQRHPGGGWLRLASECRHRCGSLSRG